MKRLLVVVLIAALGSYASAGDMTADELIAKYVEAIGGRANLDDAKTLFVKGSMFVEGTPLEMKMWVVFPDKSYSEISMSNMVMGTSGCNGEDAWLTQMGQTFYLDGGMKQSAFRQADFFPLIDYKKRGRAVEYLGEATVKGDPAHKLQLVHAEGDTAIYYFDSETFYTVKEESEGTSRTMSGFKEFGNIIWPTKVSISTPQGQQMFTFDSIAVNVEVPDSFFVMPENAQPLPGMSQQEPADTVQPEEPEK